MDVAPPKDSVATPLQAALCRTSLRFNYYQASPGPIAMPPPRLQLLDLPNELLDAIALHINPTRASDLRNLSLVCRRLRPAAQSALLKPVIVSRLNIQTLLETLIDRPDLALKINALDLYQHGSSDFAVKWSMDGPEIAACERLITSTPGLGTACWKQIMSSSPDELTESVFVAFLASIAPNLRKLVVKKGRLSPQRWYPHRLQLTLTILGNPFLGKRIQALVIEEDIWTKHGYRLHPWNLTTFCALKRLDLPMALLLNQRKAVSLENVLPQTIMHLEVRSGPWTRLALELLERLLETKDLSKLENLELSFESNLRATILLVGQGDETRIARFSAAAHALSHSGVQVTAFTPTDYLVTSSSSLVKWEAQRLEAELRASASLSISEIQTAVLRKCYFAEIVARDRAGTPRPRSRFEQLLFVRFWRMPLALFTSPTFDPPAWSGVRMFNGQTVAPMTPGACESRGRKEKPNFSSREGTVIPERKEKPFILCWEDGSAVKQKDLCSCTFISDPQLIQPAPETSTFDAIGWSKVDFFKVSKEQMTSTETGDVKSQVVKQKVKMGTAGRLRRRRPTISAQELKEASETAKDWKL